MLIPEILTPFYLLANKNLLAAPDVKRARIKKRPIAVSYNNYRAVLIVSISLYKPVSYSLYFVS